MWSNDRETAHLKFPLTSPHEVLFENILTCKLQRVNGTRIDNKNNTIRY